MIILLLLTYNCLCHSCVSQNMATRWASGNERYSQISVFFPEGNEKIGIDEIGNISSYIRRSVSEYVDNKNDVSTMMKDAYSTSQVDVEVSRYNSSETISAKVVGVNSSFFSFHPLDLIDGNYIYDSSLNVNSAVIDEEAAWNIFFSLDVAGMSFFIGENEYYVQGVVKKEDSCNVKAVYPDKPLIYLNSKAMIEMLPDISILCYESVIPSPIDNYAKELLLEYYSAGSFDESENSEDSLSCEIVDNTYRMSYISIIQNALHFTQTGVVTRPIAYPYWENAARILINKLTIIMLIVIVLAVYNLSVTIFWLIKKFRNRKWHLSNLTNKLIIRFTYKNRI